MAKQGTIGVVHARFVPETLVSGFTKEERLCGITKGAIKGTLFPIWLAGYGIAEGGAGGGGVAVLAMVILGLALIVLAPAVGIIGGILGAAKPDLVSKGKETENSVKEASVPPEIQKTMRDHFLQVAEKQTAYRFVSLKEHGPALPEEQVRYGSLADQEIDTVLEISVLKFGFNGACDDDSNDPSVEMLMTVRTRLIDTTNDKLLYENRLDHRGEKHKLTDWAADNAQLAQVELDRAFQSLSEKIVVEVSSPDSFTYPKDDKG